MGIVIINASPRKNGSCKKIANDIKNILDLKGIESEIFNIYDMDIDYCNACGFCEKIKGCRIKDDMTNLYDTFDKSMGTVVVSPVYFDSVPAKMKTVIDRTQAVYSSKFVIGDSIIDRSKNRLGMYIAVGGSKGYESQFSGGDIVMDFFFKSINSKCMCKLRMNDSDNSSYDDNIKFKKELDIKSEEYAEKILDLINQKGY